MNNEIHPCVRVAAYQKKPIFRPYTRVKMWTNSAHSTEGVVYPSKVAPLMGGQPLPRSSDLPTGGFPP